MNENTPIGDPPVTGQLAGTASLPLLTTKLYRPPTTPHLEQRDRLIERFERNRQRSLTLILAPAGYGKTTLASVWLEFSDWASAWFSLDEGDNDLITFVRYLLAAVKGTFPDLELKIESLLDAPNLPSVPVLARYLLNDFDQLQEPLLLALDDVHLITEPAVFELVNQLLRHPSPFLHLALIGRHTPPLPIASLRAQGQVTEIRAPDLRFTPQETAGLLGRMLDREIDPAVAEEWTEKTEGWVTALRLAGLSLRYRDQTQDLHASTQADSRYLRDYLLAEVMAHLPAAHQAWLVKTSVLDRFCAPLCEAVCQAGAECAETGLDGEAFIAWLERENLFLVPLDARHEWFRFHHLFQRLLQDMLASQVQAEGANALRLAASRWCAENGLIEEALGYALAAGDVTGAVELVEQHRYRLMNTEQWHRLDRWLRRLPVDVVTQNPFLIITKTYTVFHRGRDADMVSSLRRAEQLLANLTPGTEAFGILQSEIDIMHVLINVIAGQPVQSTDRVQLGLKRLPAQALQIRSLALAAMAVSLQMLGDVKGGVDVIRNALAETTWPDELQARKMSYLCIIFFLEGDLSQVLASARTCVRISEKIQASITLNWGRYHLGIVHYLRNEFTQAERVLGALLKEPVITAPVYLAHGAFALALIYQAQGRMDDADQLIQLLGDHFRDIEDTIPFAYLKAMLVEMAFRQGKLAQARQLSKRASFEIRPSPWFFYLPELTPIKLLWAEGSRESLKEARARLDALDDEMRRVHRNNVRIDVLALQALVYDALGDETAAIEKLRDALALGEPGGFIRTFVDLGTPMAELLLRLQDQEAGDGFAMSKHHSAYRSSNSYVDQILSAFPKEAVETAQARMSSQPGSRPPRSTLVEPLTEREYQTLRLLATDLSTEEIAAELFVSIATVYSYSKRIYAKLAAHSRIQAVRRAEELGLL